MQTVSTINMVDGVLGGRYDAQDCEIISGTVHSAVMPFGRGVVCEAGTIVGEGKFVTPISDSNAFVGLSLRDMTKVNSEYVLTDTCAVAKEGVLWVETEEAITSRNNSAVYMRFVGKRQVQTFVLSADLIGSNVLSAKFNGIPLSYEYDTSHVLSMGAFATLIAALPFVHSAVVGGANNRTITITAEMDVSIAVTDEDIAGGISQATITITETVHPIASTDAGKFRATDSDGGTCVLVYGARWYANHDSGMAPLELINGAYTLPAQG
jgi:hypothetical protein